MLKTSICDLFGIKYPIFQGGMAWVSDAVLAAAVSNAGGLGIIAAGNAPASYVTEQVKKAKSLTTKPFGVNIMLMSPFAEDAAKVVAEEKLDGKYFIKTSDDTLSLADIVLGYRKLHDIERWFRTIKCELELRLVDHRKEHVSKRMHYSVGRRC